ncbi:MAG TPA: CBS domain-containing protein [Pyrinomonadaceae bacterium]|jgi:CBS domain-containing protein/gamma-glutamyl:cysteine ligase YbdK (ATP-grasp superfamily)
MGEHNVEQELDQQKLHEFMQALLADLRALAFMLEQGRIESGVRRIGAEQEMFLVDRNLRPAPLAMEVLERAGDDRLTTEMARFNLEANLTPLVLTGRCFHLMHEELKELLAKAQLSALEFGADVLLAGILPTLRVSDLTLANLTPLPRYQELNRAVAQLRGGPFSIHIKGLDELQLTHDNMMMESCNTSFQVHFQVNPSEFVATYNIAQAITAPVLAAAVNSPLLFGHRLWQETRLALFQHSADARSQTQLARSQPTRVGFGEQWLRQSVIELLHDQIARFRPIMITRPDEDPMQVLARGEIPLLSALRMHNGTVWPWNRACYGVSNGVAHLRIENRALPSGPTAIDEIANAAFFAGLMLSLPGEYGDISKRMSFDDAKTNFFAAARYGLNAQFNWIDGISYSASSLIRDHLLLLARQGLAGAGVDTSDIDTYLGVIEERVQSGRTGAQWMLKSLSATEGPGPKDMPYRLLTSAMLQRQKEGKPVHTWPIMDSTDNSDWCQSYQTVGQFMTTDLFTLRPDDLIDLAASVMDWRHIRHVPVEDNEGRLVGLITHRALLRLLNRASQTQNTSPLTVRGIMKTDPVTVSSTTPTLEALELMRCHKVGCLPVVDDNRLVGILTSYDFLDASARLFKERLTASENLRAIAQGLGYVPG